MAGAVSGCGGVGVLGAVGGGILGLAAAAAAADLEWVEQAAKLERGKAQVPVVPCGQGIGPAPCVGAGNTGPK